MISLDADFRQFYFKMGKVSRVTGLTMFEVGHHAMALLVKSAMSRTPPLGNTEGARKVGDRRVYKDVTSIIRAVPDDQFNQFGADWVAVNDGNPIGHMFKRKDGSVYGVDYDMLGTNVGILQREHTKARNPKTGRTSTSGTYTRNVGRWKFVNRVHAPAALRREYLKTVQAHVGKTKSGWLAALSYFCRVGRSKFPSTIDWVQRHGSMHGKFVNGMNPATGGGFLSATNSIPWIGRFAGLINFAVKVQERDFNRGFFEKRLIGAFKKAGI